MRDDVLEFLPPDLDVAQLGGHALVERGFDRPEGQVLVVVWRDGRRSLLTRPSDFELFRAIPLHAEEPLDVVHHDAGAQLEARVIDGRVLTLALLGEEVSRVEDVVLSERERRRRAARARRQRTSKNDWVRPPESVEAEIVVVSERVLQKVSTPVPERIRGEGAVADLARQILGEARTTPSTPKPPVPSAEAPAPIEHDDDERPSTVPPALAPSREALAQARGEEAPASDKHDSVRPPAFVETPTSSPLREALRETSPRDAGALRARLRQHWERGELDEASQVARVLAFLGTADATEKRLASLPGDGPPSFATPLANHLFKAYVAHDDEDPDVARLCAALWPALLTMRLRPERDLGLRTRDAADVANAETGFAAVFRRAARALGVPLPRLWIRNDVSGGLAYLNVSPIGSLCGGSLSGSFTHEQSLFVAAHHLSFYRPEVYLLALLPSPSDLLTLVCAGLYLERRMPPDSRVVKVAESLERFMVPQVRDSLRAACGELPLPGDPRTHIADALVRFRRAAHFSAVRAGFAVTGSIALAARMTKLLPPHGIAVSELVDDLASYAVSDAWLTLRRELGIALAPSAPETTV